jgi:hypothetical protein
MKYLAAIFDTVRAAGGIPLLLLTPRDTVMRVIVSYAFSSTERTEQAVANCHGITVVSLHTLRSAFAPFIYYA